MTYCDIIDDSVYSDLVPLWSIDQNAMYPATVNYIEVTNNVRIIEKQR